MTTIDDLGRRAATTALADTMGDVDVERGLADVLAAAPTMTTVEPYEAYGTRRTRTPWLAVAASLLVIAGTAVALALLSGTTRRTVVPSDTVDTALPATTVAPSTTATPTTAPATTTPATTTPATTTPAVTPTTSASSTGVTLEPLGITNECDPICPSVRFDPGGNLVVYDPATATLRISGPTPRTVDVSAAGLNPQASYLEVVGSDQVAYLATQPADVVDPIGDLVAIATTGPREGQVVARADGVVDLSGDSDLVAAPTGVVAVGCCDPTATRPDPAATPLLGWFDSAGVQSIDGPPDLRVQFDGSTATVVRQTGATSTTWTIDGVAGYRGMPPLVGTDDGGAMISLQDPFDSMTSSRLVVLHPDGSQEERSIDPYLPIALSPDGSVLVLRDDGEYARLRLDGIDVQLSGLSGDEAAIAPFVDPAVCATTSSGVHTSTQFELKPFADSAIAPLAIQVIGSPTPDGATQPFAVILRYSPPPRDVGTTTRRIGDWDVALSVSGNGNGEARWDLPDGSQGSLRSRGLDEAALAGLIERLSSRNLGADVPGFDYDATGAPSDLRLVVDATATVDASLGSATCVVPTTGDRYTISTLDGDPAFVFLGVIDRPVPLEVGVVGDDVVVIDGIDDADRPSVADVVARPDAT